MSEIPLRQGWAGFTVHNYRHPTKDIKSGGFYVTTIERIPKEYWAQHGSAYQIAYSSGYGYETSRESTKLTEPPSAGDAGPGVLGWAIIPLYYKQFDLAPDNVDPIWGEEGL